MLRVLPDVLNATNDQHVTLMGLLDLTAAFDCLQLNFGFVDTILCWLTSFVTGRTQQVTYEGQLSPTTRVVIWYCAGVFLGPVVRLMHC